MKWLLSSIVIAAILSGCAPVAPTGMSGYFLKGFDVGNKKIIVSAPQFEEDFRETIESEIADKLTQNGISSLKFFETFPLDNKYTQAEIEAKLDQMKVDCFLIVQHEAVVNRMELVEGTPYKITTPIGPGLDQTEVGSIVVPKFTKNVITWIRLLDRGSEKIILETAAVSGTNGLMGLEKGMGRGISEKLISTLGKLGLIANRKAGM